MDYKSRNSNYKPERTETTPPLRARLRKGTKWCLQPLSPSIKAFPKKAETAERYLFNETSKEIKLQEAPITDRLSPDTLSESYRPAP